MTATYVSSSTAFSSGQPGTLVVNNPAGLVNGNQLIAFFWAYNGGATTIVTPPAGWTFVNEANNTGTSQFRFVCYTRMVASEPASYTWTLPTSGTCPGAIVLQYTPCVVDGSTYSLYSGPPTGGTTWTSSAFTAGNATDTVLTAIGAGNPNGSTTPSGTTSRQANWFTNFTTMGLQVFDSNPGTTSVPAYSATISTTNAWGTVSVALKDASLVHSLYVGTQASSSVWVVDPVAGSAITTVTMGCAGSANVLVSPNGNWCAVAAGNGTMQFLATATNTPSGSVLTPGVGSTGIGLAWAPDSSKVYMTGGGNAISITPAGVLGTLWTVAGAANGQAAISPDGAFLYVTTGTGVVQVNTTTGAVTATYSTGASAPFGICVTPDGTKLYAVVYGTGFVYPITIAGGVVGAGISVSGGYGCCISPDGSRVWVANYTAGQVAVISTSSNTVIQTVGVASAFGTAITPDGSRVWASNYGGNTIVPINTTTYAAGTALTGPATHTHTLSMIPAANAVTGTVTMALGPLTTVATGGVPPNTGTVAMALGPVTLSANGFASIPGLVGAAALNLGPLTMTGIGRIATGFSGGGIIPGVLQAVQIQLEGGPLDGEIQIVRSTRTDPNHVLRFNVTTHQSFDGNGDVVAKGLIVDYVFSGEIPLKQHGAFDPVIPNTYITGDYWQHNYLYRYGGREGSFIPLPAPIAPLAPLPLTIQLAGQVQSMTRMRGFITSASPLVLNAKSKGTSSVSAALATPTAFTMGRSTLASLDTFERGLPKLLRSPVVGGARVNANMSPFVSAAISGATGVTTAGAAVTVPPNLVAGNMLFTFIYYYLGGLTADIAATPAGWTLVNKNYDSSPQSVLGIYSRVVDGTEPASYIWHFTTENGTGGYSASMMQYLFVAADGNSLIYAQSTTNKWSSAAATAGDPGDFVIISLHCLQAGSTAAATAPVSPSIVTPRTAGAFGSASSMGNWTWEVKPGLTAIPVFTNSLVNNNQNYHVGVLAIKRVPPPTQLPAVASKGQSLTNGNMSPFVNSTVNGYSNNVSGVLTGTINVPASPQLGNLLVAFVYFYVGNISAAITGVPAGWTQVAYSSQNGTLPNSGGASAMGIYTRVIDGTEPASYTWNFTGYGPGWWSGSILQYLPCTVEGSSTNFGNPVTWQSNPYTSTNPDYSVISLHSVTASTTTAPTGSAGSVIPRSYGTFGIMNCTNWVWENAPGTTSVPVYTGTGLSNQNWYVGVVSLKPIPRPLPVPYVNSTALQVMTASITFNMPAGIVNGDILLLGLYGYTSPNPPTITPPPGWNLLIADSNSPPHTGVECLNVYWKYAYNEPSTYSASVAGGGVIGAVVAVYGPGQIDAFNINPWPSGQSYWNTLALTAQYSDDTVAVLVCQHNANNFGTNPAGLTQRAVNTTSFPLGVAEYDGVPASTAIPAYTSGSTGAANIGGLASVVALTPLRNFVSGAAASSGGSASTVTVNAPTNIIPGNLLVIVAADGINSNLMWSCPGFTNVFNQAGDFSVAVLTKIATTSEPSTYVVNNGGVGAGDAVVCYQYAGVQGLDGVPGFAHGAFPTGTETLPSLTPSGTGRVLLAVYAVSSGITVSTPTGLTPRPSNQGATPGIAGFDQNLGSSTAATGTITATSANTAWGGVSLLLAPRPTPLVSAAVAGGAGAPADTSVTVNAPANIATGNFLVAIMYAGVQGVAITSVGAPSGWTQQGTLNGSAGSGYSAVFTKVATASEPSTYTFTATGGAYPSPSVTVMCLTGLTGVVDAGPAFNPVSSSGTTWSAPSLTPTTTGDTLLVWQGNRNGVVVGCPPAMANAPFNSGNSGCSFSIYYSPWPTSGATGAVGGTCSATMSYVGGAILLR